MYHTFIINLTDEGHLVYFHFLAIMHRVIMNTVEQLSVK